jgi:hypothetical protein
MRVGDLPGNLDIDLAIVILRQVIEPPAVDVSAKSCCSFFFISSYSRKHQFGTKIWNLKYHHSALNDKRGWGPSAPALWFK